MAKIERFEDIDAWQAARELMWMVYAVFTRGSFARDYRLRDQIQGSAISVMPNVAEGFDAGGDAEFIRFLGYARRSATNCSSNSTLPSTRTTLTKSNSIASIGKPRKPSS